jgi:thiol-disulfide isomerase/thioredoxin
VKNGITKLMFLAILLAAPTLHAAQVGAAAPLFTATLMDGGRFSTADSGGVVLINFWATWCEPCRKEMPALDAYYRKHREQGLKMVAVSMDDPADAAKVRQVMRAYAFPAAMVADVQAKGYGRIWHIPMTFVIDRNGVLRKDDWSEPNGLDEATLERVVTPLLATP